MGFVWKKLIWDLIYKRWVYAQKNAYATSNANFRIQILKTSRENVRSSTHSLITHADTQNLEKWETATLMVEG